MVMGRAIAFAPTSEPFGPGPPIPFEQPEQDLPGEMGMLLPLAVWSYSRVMMQVVPEQKETWGGELTTPPADCRPMFRVLLSEARWIWYSGPLYEANIARVVLYAASHGVPPDA